MKKYTVVGQNIYIITPEGKELICICVSVDMAIEIAATLFAYEAFANKTKNDEPEPTTGH